MRYEKVRYCGGNLFSDPDNIQVRFCGDRMRANFAIDRFEVVSVSFGADDDRSVQVQDWRLGKTADSKEGPMVGVYNMAVPHEYKDIPHITIKLEFIYGGRTYNFVADLVKETNNERKFGPRSWWHMKNRTIKCAG